MTNIDINILMQQLREAAKAVAKAIAELEAKQPEICRKLQVALVSLKQAMVMLKPVSAIPSAWIGINEFLPDGNVPVVVWDSTGEGYLIGWRSFWYSNGQRTGEWEWSFQIADMNNSNVNITHWTPLPAELKG